MVTNSNVRTTKMSPASHAATAAAVTAQHPDARIYFDRDESDGSSTMLFAAPTVKGERITIGFRDEEACFLACDAVPCLDRDGEAFEAVVLGTIGLGPVPVIDALRALRAEDFAAYCALREIVKRMGAKSSGTVTARPAKRGA